MTNNLDEIHKTYNNHKYTKILKDLYESQTSMFDNLEEFDNHDQVIIQSCFDNIYLYIIEVYEMKKSQALQNYKTELRQYKLDQTKDIESVQSILSENTIQNNIHVSKIGSQVQFLKADTSSLIEKQKKNK